MTDKRLVRSSTDSMLAGVCGGLAEYFEIDSTLVRLAFVLLEIITAGMGGILLYIILLVIMPQAEDVGEPEAEEKAPTE